MRLSSLLLSAISTVIATLSLEIGCRLVGYDFGREAYLMKRAPIFYRLPTVPVGEVFFRRQGPDHWVGKVLSTGPVPEAYRHEPDLDVTYDGLGFRNPDALDDWDIVVVGDSFTELGNLPYEDLFTTRLGSLVRRRVKNLGVSSTGPLTHIFYLERYGRSRSTKSALLVFYEGNDVIDLTREQDDLDRYRATGIRPRRDLRPQTSFLAALYRMLFRRPPAVAAWAAAFDWRNAEFVAAGRSVPVSVLETAPGRRNLSWGQRNLLEQAVARWGETARRLHLHPWLVYMPCKRRVLHGHLRFRKNAARAIVNWRPTDLPDAMRCLATNNRIGFIDMTPALIEETKYGHLTYNAVWDPHLNRDGARVVAEEIARALTQAGQGEGADVGSTGRGSCW